VKHNRAAVIRRRRLATSSLVAVAVAAIIVVSTQLPAHSHSNHSHGPGGPATMSTTDAAPAMTLHHAIATYIAHREGAISVAMFDGNTRHLMLVHSKLRGRTASIVKVDILETLLHRTGGHLTEDQRETAHEMIEHSDNDAATDLWNQDGGAPGVEAYNDDLALKQTTPNADWGLTTTSAADQVTLLRELLRHSTLLTNSARHFQRYLMRHVEADQQWGISAGVPKSATFGIKNGWLPVPKDHDRWAVNSIGWVRGQSKRYEIAVITQHNDTEGYGIQTIEHIARMAWRHAALRPSNG
jgi:hypothetical protein